jgi:ArsR family transcriptional regulator
VTGLSGRCTCVKDIWECLGLPQAVVSQHLKVMKEGGILESKRDGVKVCYSLRDERLAEIVKLLSLNF